MKFHINPVTGNPNKCSAKPGKCPFGDSFHYGTQAAARKAFEEHEAASLFNSYKKNLGLSTIVRMSELQKRVIELHREGERRTEEWENAIHQRDILNDYIIKEMPWIDNDGNDFKNNTFEKVDFLEEDFSPLSVARKGYSNDILVADSFRDSLLEEMDKLSFLWFSRLSTAELKALSLYKSDATRYAKICNNDLVPDATDEKVIKYLNSAMEKAPRSEKSFVVYSGISEERNQEILSQQDSGTIVLNRVQSFTVNPSQINSFLGWKTKTSLEIKTNIVASLTFTNLLRHEMEVLIPSGKYSIVNKGSKIEYKWPSGRGLVADHVFQIKSLDN